MNNYHHEVHRPAHAIFHRIFALMAAAIAISGISAIIVAQNPAILMRSAIVLPIMLIAQLVCVIVLSWRIATLSYAMAQILFVVYSALSGATLSLIFVVYTTASIVQVFFITAGMFAAMAIYGAYTKTDLTAYKNILYMTLWGIIIAMVVNIFLRSEAVDFITAIIGVLLFSALTAYDIQSIQQLASYLIARDEDWNKIALLGALKLYLDFVNLFLSLLRLFGRRQQ